MSHDPPAPATSSTPQPDRIAAAYRYVRGLAATHLERPISIEIKTWEDGEVLVRAYHGYGPWTPGGDRLKALLGYHSAEPTVRGALLDVDGETGAETLIFETPVAPAGGDGRTLGGA